MVYLGELSDDVCLECGASPSGHQLDRGKTRVTTLVESLTDIRDIARSGLPSSGLTVEQSQQMKLNEIAGKLTQLIESL